MSATSFFSNEAVSLEKQIHLPESPTQTKPENIDSKYEIDKCAKWIQSNNFQRVCLQFPDQLLPDSCEISSRLQKLVGQTIYVLADTAYESCCIDYIAAAHINADAIIHFGSVCFSQTLGTIPYLNVYDKHNLDIDKFKTDIKDMFFANEVSIVLDTVHLHQFDNLLKEFQEEKGINVCKITESNNYDNMIVIFCGADKRKLSNLAFTANAKEIYFYNEKLVKYDIETKVLKKRNYLMEKIKDSKTIGIIIGTLSIKNYIQVIERMKKLIEMSSKKYYLISVGKPTVGKLANFPELDIYVAVTCSMSEIYESRDFYKPIVTPYDVELALNANYNKNIKFSYDYNNCLNDSEILSAHDSDVADVSLLTNTVRSLGKDDSVTESHNTDNQIAVKSDGTVAMSDDFGAGYLSSRTWKGLEQKLGQTEAELATEGRRGLAQKYSNELNL